MGARVRADGGVGDQWKVPMPPPYVGHQCGACGLLLGRYGRGIIHIALVLDANGKKVGVGPTQELAALLRYSIAPCGIALIDELVDVALPVNEVVDRCCACGVGQPVEARLRIPGCSVHDDIRDSKTGTPLPVVGGGHGDGMSVVGVQCGQLLVLSVDGR